MSVPSQTIGLWTWQLPDWDLTTQRRDLALVQEAWGSHMGQILESLYPGLHQVVGSSDFVFCFMHYEHWAQLELRRLWVLDVPSNAVLGYIRADQWKTLVDSRDAGIPNEKPWENLLLTPEEVQAFLSDGRMHELTALLPVPITEEWVVCKSKFNLGPKAAGSPLGAFERLPTSIEDAKAFREKGPRRRRTSEQR